MPPPKPDHLQGRASTAKRLTALAIGYENELARTVLITIFSYFESYIKALLTEIIEFHDLINRQDWEICERAQKGQRSRGYGRGVYPPQDEHVYEFDQRYLRERGPD